MNILLISNTCSKNEFERVQKLKSSEKISPQQNFFSMFIEGLLENNEVERVICVAVRTIAESNTNISELSDWTEYVSNRLSFVYTRVVSCNGKRNIVNYLETKRTIRRVIQNNNSINKTNTVAIIDPLACDLACGAIDALGEIPKVAVVTDIPVFIGAINKSSGKMKALKYQLKQQIFLRSIQKMQGYCFLTEAMNSINFQHKPYCIVEGMVPMTMRPPVKMGKNKKRIVMYAGGLYEKFGVKNLIEAAKELHREKFELHLYGEGNCIDYIKEVQSSYPNIVYKGVVGVDEIKEAERNATLLVNARPCDEEFTKYSFPSKTLEYMSSGRPVLTTKLPGIPVEYFNYLYTMNDNCIDTIRSTLIELLSLAENELDEKGLRAQRYVAENKNAKAQTMKFIKMAKGICNEKFSLLQRN